MLEEWRVFRFHERSYEVSSHGRLRRLLKNQQYRYIKGVINSDGYLRVRLSYNYINKAYMMHRLVGYVFLGLTDDMFMNHIDGYKLNNKLNNLEVCTHKENIQHAVRTGLFDNLKGERNFSSKLVPDDIRRIRTSQRTVSNYKLARLYGVDASTICRIKNKEDWKHIE